MYAIWDKKFGHYLTDNWYSPILFPTDDTAERYAELHIGSSDWRDVYEIREVEIVEVK